MAAVRCPPNKTFADRRQVVRGSTGCVPAANVRVSRAVESHQFQACYISLVNAASPRSYFASRGQSPPIPVSLGRLRWSLPLLLDGGCPSRPASSCVRPDAPPVATIRSVLSCSPGLPHAEQRASALDWDSPAAVPLWVALSVQMPASPSAFTLMLPSEATYRAAAARGVS